MRLFRKLTREDTGPSGQADTSKQALQPTTQNPRPWQLERSGLHILQDPSEAVVDVVFVHGFLGDLETTWTGGKKKFWPGDSEFWTGSMVKARVFTFGYNTALFGGSHADIFDAWNSLLSALYSERRKQCPDRPIIFIAHSMGGILVKQAINSAGQNETYRPIAAATKAILFFGTPHRGAAIALWAEQAIKVIDAATFGFSGRDPFISGLRRNAPHLIQITSDFAGKFSNIEIRTFYETQPTKGIMIVQKDSCVLIGGGNERLIPMQGADHSTICKFDSPKGTRFRLVKDAIEELIETICQSDTIRIRVDVEIVQEILNYPTRLTRYGAVRERHNSTLEWIFRTDAKQPEVSKLFQSWLKSGEGCFWISGKPGSGKTTLMKYIYDSPQTGQLLGTTAHGVPCLVLPFFFWAHGNTIEKDRPGMLRSLLFEAIKLLPALRIEIFPQLEEFDWAHTHKLPLTLDTLIGGFRRLLCQTQIPCRVLFLIDGLDEFSEPDPAVSLSELTDLLLEVSQSKNCKILVSSRPWALLENAFQKYPHFRLQDHTSDDISRYVFDRLHNNRQAQHLQLDKQSVIDEIVDVANGVFLWVRVVVESVIEGFVQFDSASELRTRLQELPRELDDLYSHIFYRIPSRYKEQAYRIFQTYLIHTLMNTDSTETAWTMSKVAYAELKIDTLTAADLHFAMQMDLPDINDLEEFVHIFDMRLKARCFGMLETRPIHIRQSRGIPTSPSLRTARVAFIHRSAFEFLCKERTQSKMKKLLLKVGFDPVCSLLHSCWKQIAWNRRVSNRSMESYGLHVSYGITREIERAFKIARNQHNHTSPNMVSTLEAIDAEMTAHVLPLKLNDEDFHWSHVVPTWHVSVDLVKNLLSLAVQHGIMFYVKSKAQSHGDLALCQHYRLSLMTACPLRQSDKFRLSPFNVDMVEFLLKAGLDPNDDLQGSGCWKHVQETQNITFSKEFGNWINYVQWTPLDNEYVAVEGLAIIRLLFLFLKYGANPNLIELRGQEIDSKDGHHIDCLFGLVLHIMEAYFPNMKQPFVQLLIAMRDEAKRETKKLMNYVEELIVGERRLRRERLVRIRFNHNSQVKNLDHLVEIVV